MNEAHEEGGILFGPDQDSYVKLVLSSEGGQTGLQFMDEQRFSSGIRHYLPQTVYDIGSFAGIATIDLFMCGDPRTGAVRALYRINDGSIVELPNKLTIKENKYGAFFSPAARGGVMAQNKNDSGGIDVTFDQFAIQRGSVSPGGATPSATAGKISTAP